MQKVNYEKSKDKICNAMRHIDHIIDFLVGEEEKKAVKASTFEKFQQEPIFFDFISFNYTNTLDQCIKIIKKITNNNQKYIGFHTCNNTVYCNEIGKILHVHGTVDANMVLGVNDISQISNHSLFECDNGEIYKNSIIKIQANKSNKDGTDLKAKQMIDNSQLIFIYGMSIGPTDKLWWDRISIWLNGDKDRHLIIQKHDLLSQNDVTNTTFILAQSNQKKDFLTYSSLKEFEKERISEQIHVIGGNLFHELSNIVNETNTLNEIHLSEQSAVIEKELALI